MKQSPYFKHRGRKVIIINSHRWAGCSGILLGTEDTPEGRKYKIRLSNGAGGQDVLADKKDYRMQHE
jgi:hypothetical protein